jgi:hypothetical protein
MTDTFRKWIQNIFVVKFFVPCIQSVRVYMAYSIDCINWTFMNQMVGYYALRCCCYRNEVEDIHLPQVVWTTLRHLPSRWTMKIHLFCPKTEPWIMI